MQPARLGYKKRIQTDRCARVQCQSVKKQYRRCNCYDCRTDWEVSSDGRGNGGTVPAVGKEDDGAGRKIIAEKYM